MTTTGIDRGLGGGSQSQARGSRLVGRLQTAVGGAVPIREIETRFNAVVTIVLKSVSFLTWVNKQLNRWVKVYPEKTIHHESGEPTAKNRLFPCNTTYVACLLYC